jgi:hypothetical protein
MTKRAILCAVASVLILSACGGDPPPATVADEEPKAEAPVAQAAAPQAPALTPLPPPEIPANYVPSPTPAPPPMVNGHQPQESYVTKQADALIPADAIGGSPVTNDDDAWYRGKAAMQKYCEDNGIPFANFAVKEPPVATNGYWTMQYFGTHHNQGVYVGIRVYPDGRAEVMR